MITINDMKYKHYSKDDFVFFWGHTDHQASDIGKQCLSQWYHSPFVVGDLCYNCAEQYMMAEKAYAFGDEHIWHEIMAAYDPLIIKKLGRRVRNFNGYVWNIYCNEVVKSGNLAKFTQNTKLKEFLLSTGDKILVEASPKDTIWGIGLSADDPNVCIPDRWPGENRLGFILMEVRDIIRGKESEQSEHENSVKQALKMWTMGAGNSGRRFNLENPMPEKSRIATADSWRTRKLDKFVTVPQNFYLIAEQMRVVRFGHIPDAMEDHWFMYCDDKAIRYFRSWTGICFAEAYYEKCGDEYHITEMRINNNPKEYQLNDVDAAVALFYGLLVSEYGGFAHPYWKAAF